MRHWILIGGLLSASAGHAAVHVKSVSLTPNSRGWRVSVDASGKARYILRTYSEPARLIIDIPNATLDVDAHVAPADAGKTPVLRYSQFTRKPDAVRVVVNLPLGAGPWREVSASPSGEVIVEIPGPAAGAVAKKPTAPKRLRQAEARHPARRVIAPPVPAGSPAPRKAIRSRLASRGGQVDDTELMVDPAQASSPAWDPADAVALINQGECPKELRERLIEVVSDPTIQTSRYVWGAEKPGQFDCSGLAVYIYQAIGVKLPRCSWQQCAVGEAIAYASLHAGDLVFFNIKGTGVSHVGIYLGEGQFLHAASPKDNLKITSLDAPFYAVRYAGARRVYGVSTDTSTIGG